MGLKISLDRISKLERVSMPVMRCDFDGNEDIEQYRVRSLSIICECAILRLLYVFINIYRKK